MGCNCGGSKVASQAGKTYVAPDGKETTYPTEVEAKAAQIRAGGAGSVK